MSAHSEFVVRVEHYGDLVLEVDCDDLIDAALTAVDLRPHHKGMSVEVYRPDNIDLGVPRGLTRDQQEQVEEIEYEREMWAEDARRDARRTRDESARHVAYDAHMAVVKGEES